MNPTVSGQNRFRNAASACPICGGWDATDRGQGKRCSGFATSDGQYVNCSREELSGDIQANAGGLYGHRMRGPCKCGSTHGPGGAPEPEATYDYRDESGVLLSQVVRWPGKRFSQRRPTTNGGWEPRLGDARRVLYRLADVMASTGTVYIVEGEKDVDILRRAGYVATCNLGGSGASSWRNVQDHARTILRGRTVVVIADLDGEQQQYAGQKHAQRVADSLRDIAMVRGPLVCTRGKDAAAHLAAGGTLDELVDMVPPPAPSRAPEAASGTRPRLAVVRDDGPAWGDEEPPNPDKNARPEIRIGVDIHRILDELDEKLGPLAGGLYQRSFELVTIVGATGKVRLAEGTPIIRPMTTAALLPTVTRHVQFTAYEAPSDKACRLAEASGKRAEGEVRNIVPPKNILQSFIEVAGWKHVRPIIGVTESPLFRPDGTIRQEAGYDEATGYLFQPTCSYPVVPDSPTQHEAKVALVELLDVFADFPYANEASRLVPISAILSILGRAAIVGPVPAHLFDASVQGSGKTLQCDVCHLIATGRVPAHANWPTADEDQEKLLSTYANASPPGIVLDNVKGVLGGSALEQTLTSESVEFRQLGGLSLRTLPWRSVVMISGNNVAVTDDMVRRTLMTRIESPLENPTERTDFAHRELLEWVRDERPRLVVAALTMLRAYACKGFPASDVHLASYSGWARIVAATIRFSGGGDVTRAQPPRERAALDDSGAAATLAEHLGALVQQPMSMTQILALVYPAPGRNDPPDGHGAIREAFEALSPAKGPNGPSSMGVSRKLAKFQGRWFGNRRIRSLIDAHSKSMVWSVEVR